MFKLILVGLLFGLVASVPLRQNETVTDLETALLLPEFEALANTSIVLETMPEVKEAIEQSPEFQKAIEIEHEREALKFFKNETSELETELNELETEMQNDEFEMEEHRLRILDQVKEAERLESKKFFDEERSGRLMNEIVETLNRTETEVFMNETGNLTLRLELAREDLPLEERVKLLGEQFNETVREEVLQKEMELIELGTELEETERNVTVVEQERENTRVRTELLKEKMKNNEDRFNTLFEKLNTFEKNMTDMRLRLNKSMEEEEVLLKEKRSYGHMTPPMATVPTTTVSYGGYETTTVVVPMATVPTTTEARYEAFVVPTSEQPEQRHYREVRDIMDKITMHLHEKHANVNNFVSSLYCKSGEKFQYFKVHPTDANKYVECNPWGNGTVRECPEGRLWDQYHEICTIPAIYEASLNQTTFFEELEKMESKFEEVTCNQTDYSCLNEGRCEEFETGYECVCGRYFTGKFCEHRVIDGSIFSEIMTKTFNLTEFEQVLLKENVQEDISEEEMTEMRHFFDNTTHEEIMTYLNSTERSGLRYDTLMNNLVEAILEDIYPDAYYMSVFNVSTNTLLNVVRTIPAMASYSRFSEERFGEVFLKYNEVLKKLVHQLNTTEFRTYTTTYLNMTERVMNETDLFESFFGFNRTTKDEVFEFLDTTYNKTTEETMEFMMELESLRSYFIEFMRENPQYINTRLNQLEDCKEVRKLITIFNEMTRNSMEVINSLFTYGFWTVTDSFSQFEF